MLKWVGGSIGIEQSSLFAPARDLSDDEVAEYGGEAALLATGCYVRLDAGGGSASKKAKGGSDNKAVLPQVDNKAADTIDVAADQQPEG